MVGGIGSGYNIRFEGQLINKVKKFNYLGSIMQKNFYGRS